MADKKKSNSKSKTVEQVVKKVRASVKAKKPNAVSAAKQVGSNAKTSTKTNSKQIAGTMTSSASRTVTPVASQKTKTSNSRTTAGNMKVTSPKAKGAANTKPTAGRPAKKVAPAGDHLHQEIVTISQFKKAQLDNILAELGRRDRKLRALMPKVEGGFSLKTQDTDSPFAAVAESIVYQQLTGKAAATIFGRVKALFKSELCPSPAQIQSAPDTVLRSAGLSRSKVVALKDLADKTINGLIPTLDEISTMTDDEIITCLSAVKGVGVWTAHMFLIFRLGRLDVMPSGDYGVKKGFALTYGDGESLPSPGELERFAEIWRPYRTVGSWYMWRAIELHRKSR